MHPIAAIAAPIIINITPPTQSSPPPLPLPPIPIPLPSPRLHARRIRIRIRIACPIFDPLTLHPPITRAPTPPPLDLIPTQTTPPIPGILLTPTTTRPSPTLTPLPVLAPTALYSTAPSLAHPLIHLLPPNLGPHVCQGNARSL